MRAARRAGLVALSLVAFAAVCTPWPLFESGAPVRIEREVAATGRAPRLVLLVSIDGLAPRFLAAAATPTLDRLASEGVRAGRALTISPPVTLPSHASMLSGRPPATHGLDWNRYQPWREVRLDGVFARCAGAGLRCGLFAGKRKFAHFAEHQPGVERYAYGDGGARVVELAADYIRERQPDFVMVHLAEVDRTGHADGWGEAPQLAAIAAADRQLARLLEAAADGGRRFSVLVTADHGGLGTQHHQDVPENRRIPWIAWGDGVPSDADLADVATFDTAPTVLGLLGVPVPAGWQGRDRFAAAAAAAN